jgi:8-oxo-dGTP diphosphatase
MSTPQFGTPEPGRAYPDRPAAFVVVERDGLIATVRVELPSGRIRLDLPGGGVDPGETAAQAAVRECAEEAGLRVTVSQPFAHADHYFVNEQDRSVNTRGAFFVGQFEAEEPGLKTEDDHALVWMDPFHALRSLHRDAHAWAVAAWLRRC